MFQSTLDPWMVPPQLLGRRGRGIAHALKRATIRFARDRGAAYLWTSNDSTNAPMLAVNWRFGYRSRPALLDVALAL
jgi:mycothiol synthase